MLAGLKDLNPKRLYRAYMVRVTVLAMLSTLTAYNVAQLLPGVVSPIIAGIIALTAMKPTFHDTVLETLRQIVGTTVGAVLGIILINFIGFNALSMAIIVAISMTTGWVLKVQVQGGLTIAATILLVSGPLLGDLESVEQRVAGVVLGALCALIASAFISPSNPHKRILAKTLLQGKRVSKLLKQIGLSIASDTVTYKESDGWLEEINLIIDEIQETRRQIISAENDARWSPLINVEDVQKVHQQININKSNAMNVRSICEAIINGLDHSTKLTPKAYTALSKLLVETSGGIKDQIKLAEEEPSRLLIDDRAKNIRARRKKVAEELTKMDDPRAIMLGGALIYESTRIKDSISAAETADED